MEAMITTLLSHAWKKFVRSVAFEKELATNIFLGFIAVIVFGYAIAFGFFLEKIVTNGLNQPDSVQFVSSLLLYYFGFEFMLRYFMQSTPALDVQPYLHLPVSRRYLVHYMLIKSVLHLLNFLSLVLFAPFAFTAVAAQPGSSAWAWLLSIYLLSLSLHYIVLIFKKGLDDTVTGFLALTGAIGLLALADYYNWFRLSAASAALFEFILHNPVSVLGLVALVLLVYFFNLTYFLRSMYPEELAPRRNSNESAAQNWAFLQSFGMLGEWANLELKLILRNKRPRSALMLSAFFLLYGLIFYTNKIYTQDLPGFLLFVGIFITGIFMINYGQFLFSWQSNHFDFTLTRPVSLAQVVESKYWLLSTITVICFVLSIPYVYFGWNILLIHLAATLFNIGINVFIIMNFAMWNPKKMNLAKGSMMNYEGVGAAQWVMGIPILLSPYVFYLPFSIAGYSTWGVIAVGVAGLLGLAFRSRLLTFTTNRLQARRYAIAAGFRKD
ncbi:MAG: hypothetical protein KIT62_09695 [Cyclobacteriaceae bacterium]|nr:hypothetical protein [Cyclobacteriaceae bacterium]